MICLNCSKQWDILGKGKEQLSECPFCHNKILAKYKNFASVCEGIYYAITVGSKEDYDILTNKQRLLNFLSDTIDSSSPESNIVRNAVNSNVGKLLYDAMNGTDADKQSAVYSAVSQMNREFGTDKTKAYEVVRYFTEAMGWNITAAVPAPESTPAPAPTPAPQVQQTISQAAPGNVTMNAAPAGNATFVQPQNNAVMQQPQINNTVVPKKKSKVGLVVALIAVLIAAGAVIAVISNNKQEIPVSTPEETTAATTTAAETTTTADTEAVAAAAEVTTEETTAAETTTLETTTAETTAVETTTEETTEDNRWRLIDETIENTSEMTNIETVPSDEMTDEVTEEEIVATMGETTGEETADELSPDTERYVRNVVTNVGDIYMDVYDRSYVPVYSLQRFCVNPSENAMYYIEGTQVFSCGLDSGDPVMLRDFATLKTYNNKCLYGATLRYNPFDGKTYVMLHYDRRGILFEAHSESFSEIKIENENWLRSMFFTDKDIVDVFSGGGDCYCSVTEFNIASGSSIDGFILSGGNRYTYGDKYSTVPFLYNDDYYWLERSYNHKNPDYIVYTRNTVRNSNTDCGTQIGTISGCLSSCVYNDEIYFMTSDFSIYKVNMEVLLSQQESGNETESDTLTFSSPSASDKSPYELVVNGSKIKQTGRNNLNTIACFDVVGDGRFVVYDDFDKTYKIIEAQ